jgi:hypothetical protein
VWQQQRLVVYECSSDSASGYYFMSCGSAPMSMHLNSISTVSSTAILPFPQPRTRVVGNFTENSIDQHVGTQWEGDNETLIYSHIRKSPEISLAPLSVFLKKSKLILNIFNTIDYDKKNADILLELVDWYNGSLRTIHLPRRRASTYLPLGRERSSLHKNSFNDIVSVTGNQKFH